MGFSLNIVLRGRATTSVKQYPSRSVLLSDSVSGSSRFTRPILL